MGCERSAIAHADLLVGSINNNLDIYMQEYNIKQYNKKRC